MYFNLCCRILLILMVTMPCQGFDFRMDRREYLVKNQIYCGLLQCQGNTVSDTNMEGLIKMDIYYLKNEQLLASMLAVNSEIQTHTGNTTKVIGSMSEDHGEFHVYFSDVANCSQTAFICKIQFKNLTNGKDIAEKYTFPIDSDQRKSDIYVKTQISIEHKIFDKPETNIKKPNHYTSLMNAETGLSLELGNDGRLNSDESSMQRKNSQSENIEHYFEQKLSDFEVKIRKQLELFMIQMSSKIEDLKLNTKEFKSKFKDTTRQELTTISEQSISTIIQSHIEPTLLSLDRRMDDIVDKIDQVNVSLNLHELRTHTGGLEIIQKLNFLLAENKHIRLNVSTLDIKVTEILHNERHMNNNMKEIMNNIIQINNTMKDILENDIDMNDTMKELLKNDRRIFDTTKEIQHDVNNINKLLKELGMIGEFQQSLTLLHNKLNDSNLLNVEVTMGEVVREMQYNNVTMNDLKQSVNDKCNGDVLRNKTDQMHLEELRLSQRTILTLLVNVVKTTMDKCNAYLKCEKGLTSLLGSRLITSLDNNKQVLCDTETNGGGWIIIQRRVNGQENFTRNWNDYKNGFGSLDGDFWMGNELISNITLKEIYTLRIDMREGSNVYRAEYDSFMVKNESDNYRLHLGVFSGNIRDSLSWHNNMAFSTPDRDNDDWSSRHCAQYYKSGWWYGPGCFDSHLNGVWGLKASGGLSWWDQSGYKYLDFVEMKLRLK